MTASTQSMSAPELAALLHFYAEAGVDWLVEDAPIDRFAEMKALANAQSSSRAMPEAAPTALSRANVRQTQSPRAPAQPAPANTVPNADTVADAVARAAGAMSLEQLIEAVAGYTGCNLRNSARYTVFAGGNLSADLLIVGGVAGPDDDREGLPFAGNAGAMLDRMLAGIGLSRDQVATINLIPWRTPGDRAPAVHEVNQCLPFGMRAIELMAPRHVLALGNLPSRLLSGETKSSIHSLRGKSFKLSAGGHSVPVLSTFHPQELIAAPACKRLAWQDLLQFASDLQS